MRIIPAIFPLLIFLSFFFAIDWTFINGLSPLFSNTEFEQPIQYIYWGISIGLPLALIFSMLQFGRYGKTTARIGAVFISVFLTKLIFIGFSFIGNIFGLFFEKTEVYIVYFAATIALFIFISFLYGITKGKYRYTLHKKEIFFDDLPKAFDGFTITQISDIHSGGFKNKIGVTKGVELVKKQASDLFIFTGDLVNNQATEIEPWIDMFKTIEAPYGKYSILGNHDYGDYVAWPSKEAKKENMQRLFDNHKKIGFQLLLDEHVLIEKNNEKIAMLGVENWGIGFGKRGNLQKALHGLPDNIFKVLMSHDPSHWEHEIKSHPKKIHLTFSGHTHGMQMGIEFMGIKWSPIKFRYKKWAGLFEENGRHIYINRGFGFLGFAGRVGIWPEVTVVVLRKKNKG